MKKISIFFIVAAMFAVFLSACRAFAYDDLDPDTGVSGLMPGLAMGGGAEAPDYDLCPQGVNTIQLFMDAWKNRDYERMYDLIDDKSKTDYTLKDAVFDFKFLDYKEYRIKVIRQNGDNFEFLLSYGDWQNGDKDTVKMLIDGLSYRIIMPTRNSPFKRSAESYF